MGAPWRSFALDPLSGPFFSNHFCMARFQTMTACNRVDLPLLFGPASNVRLLRSKSCASKRLKKRVEILWIMTMLCSMVYACVLAKHSPLLRVAGVVVIICISLRRITGGVNLTSTGRQDHLFGSMEANRANAGSGAAVKSYVRSRQVKRSRLACRAWWGRRRRARWAWVSRRSTRARYRSGSPP